MKDSVFIKIIDFKYRGRCSITRDNKEYIINSLYVRNANRRKGVGTELLSSAEDIISKLGGEYSYLYVREVDKWQHDWYKRLGYSDMKVKCDSGFVKMKKKNKMI